MLIDVAVGGGPPFDTFTYEASDTLGTGVGSLVTVPWGTRIAQGIVFALRTETDLERVRPVLGAVGDGPVLWPHQIELARWLSDYYLASRFAAAALMLPPGAERNVVMVVRPGSKVAATLLPRGPTRQQTAILDVLAARGELSLPELNEAIGFDAGPHVARLAARGLVERRWTLPPPAVGPRRVRRVMARQAGRADVEALARAAPARARALALLLDAGGPVEVATLRRQWAVSDTTLRALEMAGVVAFDEVEVPRRPPASPVGGVEAPVTLTADQEAALAAVEASGGRPVLLHGVTGSGKTEVYLRATAATLASGRGVIVLLPEIALTPQTVARFVARFGDDVAVLHSGLSPGEAFDEWWRVRNGEARVVIGARSAVFAPLRDPGLIVIDEAHDAAYKQAEASPRYDARAVAIQLGASLGARVVEGTATPTIEASFRARRGVYRLAVLPERVAGGVVPVVEVVDLRAELRAGNLSMFSRRLQAALQACLDQRQQALLLLNRRGTNTHVQCRDCGYVLVCPACDLPLTYHGARRSLVCHQCNRRRVEPAACPQCRSRRIRFLGAGTDQVVREAQRLFPEARLLRWDRDAARDQLDHAEIMERFVAGEADILVGTQMLAKGLDFPGVRLVGVVNADVGINLPDFRAAERAYQLLVQVAGRAARRQLSHGSTGLVIIQTYAPEHPVIRAVASGRYEDFFDAELAFRREHNNPPYARLVRLLYVHADQASVAREGDRVRRQLLDLQEHDTSFRFVGPTPCYFGRVRGKWRSQIVLRGHLLQRVVVRLSLGPGWAIDVDPASLL